MPVRVVELDRPAQHHDLAGLFARIWRADSAADVMPASTMTAIAFAGGYVAGAYEEDRLVGGGVGFLGARACRAPMLQLTICTATWSGWTRRHRAPASGTR